MIVSMIHKLYVNIESFKGVIIELLVHEQDKSMLPVLYKSMTPVLYKSRVTVLCNPEIIHVMPIKPHRLITGVSKSGKKGMVIDMFV